MAKHAPSDKRSGRHGRGHSPITNPKYWTNPLLQAGLTVAKLLPQAAAEARGEGIDKVDIVDIV